MAKKADIKTCRYAQCSHPNREIDTSCDKFVANGRSYYHSDCYELKIKQDKKEEKVKSDLQTIKTLWVENISNTVIYSQLFHCLNDLLNRGVESEYLVFTMKYCISHKLNLNHPMGFKYFVDKKEIKDAYKKMTLSKARISQSDFSVSDTDDAPKFSITIKPNGFNSILGGNK